MRRETWCYRAISPFAVCALLALAGCGGEEVEPEPNPTGDTVNDDTCANTVASCGRTIAGALCTSGNGGSCADGLCSPQGTCGPPPCDAFDPDSCSGSTVCIAESCEPAFPRFYTLTITEVTFDLRDSEGECWDSSCGAPDPLVVVVVNDIEIGRTPVRQDTFETSFFTSPFDIELIAGSSVRLHVYDSDLTTDDLAVNCGTDSMTAEHIRGRELSCRGAAAVDIVFEIVPR